MAHPMRTTRTMAGALAHLGRYGRRTALTTQRIIAVGARTVTFRYRDTASGKRKVITLEANEFIRRFLQHVPPKGFHRVRSYGLLHHRNRPKLMAIKLVLGSPDGATKDREGASSPLPEPPSAADPPTGQTSLNTRASPTGHRTTCPSCGQGQLVMIRWYPRSRAPPPLGPLDPEGTLR